MTRWSLLHAVAISSEVGKGLGDAGAEAPALHRHTTTRRGAWAGECVFLRLWAVYPVEWPRRRIGIRH
jgi:hypothetical protein